jgi:hypothetical protein
MSAPPTRRCPRYLVSGAYAAGSRRAGGGGQTHVLARAAEHTVTSATLSTASLGARQSAPNAGAEPTTIRRRAGSSVQRCRGSTSCPAAPHGPSAARSPSAAPPVLAAGDAERCIEETASMSRVPGVSASACARPAGQCRRICCCACSLVASRACVRACVLWCSAPTARHGVRISTYQVPQHVVRRLRLQHRRVRVLCAARGWCGRPWVFGKRDHGTENANKGTKTDLRERRMRVRVRVVRVVRSGHGYSNGETHGTQNVFTLLCDL